MNVDKKKLYKAMARKKFNFVKLSQESGVARATLHGIVQGKKTTLLTITKVALALDMEVEQLLEKEDYNESKEVNA